ncbi:MAG: ABC transporter substrate-binding protein [Flavobacteriaceae bacterium]
MKRFGVGALAFAAVLGVAAGSAAADDLKIGMMLTLSGPAAALGKHVQDGFMLGLKEAGGKFGGVATEVIVADDELKPDVAVNKAKELAESDKVQIVVGTVFSNVMMAVAKPLSDAGVVVISPNAGPAPLAGQGCAPTYFNTAWQNDNNHEVMGQYAQSKGFKKVILIAPNYQAGKDSMAGFKRYFKGEVADEVFTQLGQLDFSAELARIAAAKPDAVFTFMPGGMGVNLVKQYSQAGLTGTIPFLSAFTVDETTLPATKDDAVGMFSGSQWAPNLDNAANKAFVEAFRAAYGYEPSLYASQGYDTARLIDAAVKASGGKLDKDLLVKALETATFESTRGSFKFNTNHFPIQDYYLVKAVKNDAGAYVTEAVEKVFTDHGDAYAEQCKM